VRRHSQREEFAMTADYNGWNDAPETEREAMDVYSRQESKWESLEDVMVPVFEQTIDQPGTTTAHALEDCMKPNHSPLTFRQQGIITAVYGAVILVFYTLMGVL
jgi:hypothetical protein